MYVFLFFIFFIHPLQRTKLNSAAQKVSLFGPVGPSAIKHCLFGSVGPSAIKHCLFVPDGPLGPSVYVHTLLSVYVHTLQKKDLEIEVTYGLFICGAQHNFYNHL